MRLCKSKCRSSKDAQIDSLIAHNKILDNQIAQISTTLQTRQEGALPAQPETPEHVNAITLRSGAKYDGPTMPTDDSPSRPEEESSNQDKASEPVQLEEGQTKQQIVQESKIDSPAPYQPKLPFPHRQLKSKLDKQFTKFLEVVKNLQVTVPFTDLITQVPAYAKFMKDILTRKRAFDEVETVAFTEQCSALLQNKSPPKLKDPGSYSIPCHVGNLYVDKALCDLGAALVLCPYLFV